MTAILKSRMRRVGGAARLASRAVWSIALLTFAGTLAGSGIAQAQILEYYQLDAVGNVRVVTDQAGNVIERHDYLPFGEEMNPGGNQTKRFTGKERDVETGLDYFGARYYGSKIGRFTTTDPAYTIAENLVDPQRWNRYAYGRNNPFRFPDPDGRDPKDIARGAGKGVVFGAVDFGIGLFGLLDDPGSLVTGPIDAVATAGQAYLTSEGRAQLAGQFGALDQEGRTAVLTEAITLGGIGAALGRVGGGEPEGIVYGRTDASGGIKPYVGQAMNECCYLQRQIAHGRANPSADFEFAELGRARPGRALDVLEEDFIRQGGGPTNKSNPNGGLSNKRHQMSDERYQAAGGKEPSH
jgi:RHS repeat-associated protein